MFVAAREYEEKRDYIRMKTDAPIDIQLEDDGQTLRGICRDLSAGGLRVELDRPLALHTKTEVTLSSTYGHSPELKACAVVTRVNGSPKDAKAATPISTCIVGLKIQKILN